MAMDHLPRNKCQLLIVYGLTLTTIANGYRYTMDDDHENPLTTRQHTDRSTWHASGNANRHHEEYHTPHLQEIKNGNIHILDHGNRRPSPIGKTSVRPVVLQALYQSSKRTAEMPPEMLLRYRDRDDYYYVPSNSGEDLYYDVAYEDAEAPTYQQKGKHKKAIKIYEDDKYSGNKRKQTPSTPKRKRKSQITPPPSFIPKRRVRGGRTEIKSKVLNKLRNPNYEAASQYLEGNGNNMPYYTKDDERARRYDVDRTTTESPVDVRSFIRMSTPKYELIRGMDNYVSEIPRIIKPTYKPHYVETVSPYKYLMSTITPYNSEKFLTGKNTIRFYPENAPKEWRDLQQKRETQQLYRLRHIHSITDKSPPLPATESQVPKLAGHNPEENRAKRLEKTPKRRRRRRYRKPAHVTESAVFGSGIHNTHFERPHEKDRMSYTTTTPTPWQQHIPQSHTREILPERHQQSSLHIPEITPHFDIDEREKILNYASDISVPSIALSGHPFIIKGHESLGAFVIQQISQ